MQAGGRPERRGGVVGEFLLALPATLTVLGALGLVEALRHERILFASLASSAFLIYRDPTHPMNGIRVMAGAHLCGVGLGTAAALLIGPGYGAGAAAMCATIAVLVLLNVVHPPAIATALGFAFYPQQHHAAGLFLVALAMLVALVVLELAATWMVRGLARRAGGAPS